MIAPRLCVLYFARHGETEWNASGRWQGQTDIPLNEVGRAQAKSLAGRLREAGVRAVGSSDLSRARETAEIAARELGLLVSHVDHAFRERAYGIFEGLTREQCVERYPSEWNRFEDDPLGPPPGVEPLAHVGVRMLAGLKRAAVEMVLPALIVSHGRAIRSLVTAATGADTDPLPNGAIYRFVLENGVPVEATPLAPPR
jgi:broad specificity phosphatase PhoE